MPKKVVKKSKISKPLRKKGNQRPWLKRLLVLGIFGILGVASVIAWYANTLPPIDSIYGKPKRPSLIFLDCHNKEIATYGDVYGETVTIKDVPKNLVNAVLAAEDRYFFDHPGIQWTGLLRAFWVNIREGRLAQGGSTITQQLAKNLFLNSSKSLHRKIQELLLALWLERNFTKAQILNIYLNKVYMGGGTFGMDAAAQRYFGKPSTHLKLVECAVIAGLLKSPEGYSRHKTLMKTRAQVVLARMLEAGFITQKQYNQSLVTLKNLKFVQTGRDQSVRYFTDWLMTLVPILVDTTQDDLLIRTTLDSDAQQTAANTLKTMVDKIGPEKNVTEGAAVIMDRNGAIKVMVGGHDYHIHQYNHATQAWRQAGSVFKVVTTLAALREGIAPETMISDLAYTNKKWSPKNFNWQAQGEISVHDALVYSVNTSAVRIAELAGIKAVLETAELLGFTQALPHDLTIALGTAQVTLLQLVRMMGMIANQGQQYMPYGIVEIRTMDGRILYQRPSDEPSAQVFDPEVIAKLDAMLTDVVIRGTGKAANINGYKVVGKTGTTQSFRDAWFLGYTPDFVAGVWMGNSDNTPMKRVSGSTLPAQLWKQIIEKIKPNEPPVDTTMVLDETAA